MTELCPLLAIRILIANSRCRRIFKALKLRVSLFNDDLSNEANFSQIHLAGQYLSKDICKTDTSTYPGYQNKQLFLLQIKLFKSPPFNAVISGLF